MTLKRLHFIVAFAVAFLTSAYAVWRLSGAVVRALGIERRPIVLDFVVELRRWQIGMVGDWSRTRIALVGDSVLLGDPYAKTVPDEITRTVAGLSDPSSRPGVHALAWPGIGPIAEYCVIDEIIAVRPDLVVLEVNLRSVGTGPLGAVGYPEFAGFIPEDRLLEAGGLPLSDAGITFDRMLTYHAIVAAGRERDWFYFADRQARVLHVRDAFEEWLEFETGRTELADRKVILGLTAYANVLLPGRNRAQREAAEKSLRGAIDGVSRNSARLRVLGALLRRIHDAGVPALVWVAPVNLEHLKYLNVPLDGLDRSAEAVRAIAAANGASFLDLHWALPDRAFIDSGDHVTFEEPVDGTAMLGGRIGREVARALGDRVRAPGAAPPQDGHRALQ